MYNCLFSQGSCAEARAHFFPPLGNSICLGGTALVFKHAQVLYESGRMKSL